MTPHKDLTVQSQTITSLSVHLSRHHHTMQGANDQSVMWLNMTMFQTLTISVLLNMHTYI